MKKERITSIILSGVFLGLFLLTIGYRFYNVKTAQDVMIAEDIQKLGDIFARIHNECKIIDFEHQKNYIDFLTVESFVGSEVGLMNLTYPEKWQGPYINDNPTMQEKYYMIVVTDKGHYIVPGDGGPHCAESGNFGVKLANGKIIGRDIEFTSKSDIEAMMRDPQQLLSDAGALAVRIAVGGEVL